MHSNVRSGGNDAIRNSSHHPPSGIQYRLAHWLYCLVRHHDAMPFTPEKDCRDVDNELAITASVDKLKLS
jgi:hypothetical protein